jgi:hypothetical protein
LANYEAASSEFNSFLIIAERFEAAFQHFEGVAAYKQASLEVEIASIRHSESETFIKYPPAS